MHFDAVIVGGGMVGAAAALGLAQNGFQVALVEQEAPPAFDAESPPDLRLSAIGYASVALLRQLGAWANVEQMRSAPYRRLETWEWDSARVAFDASELNLPELGYMVENRVLQLALWQSLEKTQGVTFLCPRHLKQLDYDAPVWRLTLDDDAVVETTLVVGADGAQSRVRQWAGIGVSGWQYRQSCMLISVRAEGAQQDVTWQQFTPDGPRAFLPLFDQWGSLVWYDSPQRIRQLQSLSMAQLDDAIAETFPARTGRVNAVAAGAFPLIRRHVADQTGGRVNQSRQHHGNSDQFANAVLMLTDEVIYRFEECGFYRLLRLLRQGIVRFRQLSPFQIVERDGSVVASEADRDGMKRAGLRHN